MNTLSYKTQSAKKEEVKRDWYVIDAEGMVLGRMCTQIATMLRGKHKASYTPHVDTGDNIIVINAEKVKLTGKKMMNKQYVRYSGYPGGQRFETPTSLLAKKPERIVEKAVKGMLPKNRLGRAMYKKLFVYEGAEHPHKAQKPQEFKIDK